MFNSKNIVFRFQFLDFSIYSWANLTEPYFTPTSVISISRKWWAFISINVENAIWEITIAFCFFSADYQFEIFTLFLAIPGPTLRHSWGGSLIKPMLIVFLKFWPKGHREMFFNFSKTLIFQVLGGSKRVKNGVK